LDPRGKKGVFEFQERCEGYKLWDPQNKKIVVSRDLTFDEASVMKPTSSQHVESGQTKEISQRVENDAIPRTLDGSVSFEFSPEVTGWGSYNR